MVATDLERALQDVLTEQRLQSGDLVAQYLPGHQMAGPMRMDPTGGMNPGLAEGWLKHLALLREKYPNTVGNIAMFEPTGGALSHFRTIPGAEGGVLGYRLGMNLPELSHTANLMQQRGWHTTAEYVGSPAQQVMQHEFGHALDNSLTRYLDGYGRRMAGPKQGLTQLRSQLVADALNGKVSGYARDAVGKQLAETAKKTGWSADADWLLRSGQATPEEVLINVPHGKVLKTIAAEPLAESWARNPALLSEIESGAKVAGWRGAATPTTMGLGAALLAAPLIAPIVADKIGGRLGKAVSGAGVGAGLGGFLGPEGALAGAGIGALASQIL